MNRVWMSSLATAIAVVATARIASAKPAWTARADLDGDGTADPVELRVVPAGAGDGRHSERTEVSIPCPGATCVGTVSVGKATVELEIRGGYWGGAGIRVVDVDRRDRTKQLLITQFGSDDEDPELHYTLVMWKHGALVTHDLGSGESVKVPGDGTVLVTEDLCEFLVTKTLTFRGPALTGTTESRVHTPKECSG